MAGSRKNSTVIILWLIVFAAGLLRMYRLDEYPSPVNQDELSNMYDAWSISETGADRWGRAYPILLRGFGKEGNLPALYAWLDAPFIRFSGFSVFWGRFVSALLGTVSVLLIYRLVKREIGVKWGLIAAFVTCVSPLHIQLSRTGIESAMLPAFFILLILYLWIRCRDSGFRVRELLLLGLITGFSTNCYTASRITGLLFSIVIGIDLLYQALKKQQPSGVALRSFLVLTGAVIAGAMPQLYMFAVHKDLFFPRANSELLSFSSGYFSTVLGNIKQHLGSAYLFTGTFSPNNLTVLRELPVQQLFFYSGLVLPFLPFVPLRRSVVMILLVSLLISLIPAVISVSSPHALRASGMSVINPLIITMGLFSIVTLLMKAWKRPEQKSRTFIAVVCMYGVVVVVSFLLQVKKYSEDYLMMDPNRYFGAYRSAKMINDRQDTYTGVIVVTPFANQEYLYFAAFTGIKPSEFRVMPKVVDSSGSFDVVKRMGHYYFINSDELPLFLHKASRNDTFLVVSRNRFEGPLYKLVDHFHWLGRDYLFYEYTHSDAQ